MTAAATKPADVVEVDARAGRSPTVTMRGDIDFRRAPEIRKAVTKLLERGRKRIRVKLADVVFMDSSGISALLDLAKSADERGARLVLVSPTRQLLHLLEVSGFRSLFEFEKLPKPERPLPGPVGLPIYWQMSEFSVPCDAELVANIRHRVTQVAESMPFGSEEIEDIKLAVGEAAANAFRYGCPRGRADRVNVRCIGDSQRLTVELTDAGPGFDPSLVPTPPLGSLQPGGRGIFFMRITMDEVAFSRLDRGMYVQMVKHVRAPI